MHGSEGMLAAVDASKRKLGNFVVDGEVDRFWQREGGSIGIAAFFPLKHASCEILDLISIKKFNSKKI
jgi:hypothetical protein